MTKKLVLLLTILLSFALQASADRGGFVYRNFKVEAIVHPNNEWDVTETIDVEFFEPRHGIYRYIPTRYSLQHSVAQGDGSTTNKIFTYNPTVEDISVPDETIDISSEGINKIIRIGDADREVNGLHRYVIKYRFCYPSDRLKDKDYIFHTILGTDFAEEIDNFSFNIQFEKPYLDYAAGEWEVYGGEYGETNRMVDANIEYTENSICGTASNIKPYHGITLLLNLKEGYYEGVKEVSPIPMYIALVLSLLLVGIIIAKLFVVKDASVVKTIEFYPPEGISSAEVGTIIDGSADNIDLASLIPWFASQGYLSIKEIEEKGIFSKSTKLEINKVQDLPVNAPEYQRTFFNILFSEKTEGVRLDKMGEHPNAIENTKKQLSGLYTGNEGDEKDRSLTHLDSNAFWYILLMLTTTFAFWSSNISSPFDFGELLPISFIWTLPFFIGYCFIINNASRKYVEKKIKSLFALVIRIIGAFCCYGTLSYSFLDSDSLMSEPITIAIFVVCFILTELVGRFDISTPYRAQMMGKLLGLKEFIETAEKPRLEALLQDDPQYFYKILPYALVFGISDKWAKQFKDITMEQPTWYETSTNVYSSHLFTNSMVSNLSSSVNSAITTISHDSSSASSSSGGGGFSGGGGGGGGGGSW